MRIIVLCMFLELRKVHVMFFVEVTPDITARMSGPERDGLELCEEAAQVSVVVHARGARVLYTKETGLEHVY